MKILVVDRTSIGQALLAKKIEGFDQTDLETLDVSVSLSNETDLLDRVADVDVLLIGSGLQETGREIARRVKAIAPGVSIILFVTDSWYSSGAFRAAHTAKIRKVIPEGASPLDLLQELVSIFGEFRDEGRASEGNLVTIMQPKGGLGATTLAAALGEMSGRAGRKTILWDMDVESQDLSRALNALGSEGGVLAAMIAGTKELSRSTLREICASVSKEVSVIQPPSRLAEALDLVSHPDSIAFVERLESLLRASHDNIIVDCAGRLSPVTGHLMCSSDEVIVLVDDSVLGVTALHSFLATVYSFISTNLSAVKFVRSGTGMSVKKLRDLCDPHGLFPLESWVSAAIPFDGSAGKWPGTGKTLYSVGAKQTLKALDAVVSEVGLFVSKPKARVAATVVTLATAKDPGILPGAGTYEPPKRAAGGLRALFSF